MIIFDIETDGLLDTVTKHHVLSYINVNNLSEGIKSLYEPEDIINLFLENQVICGHNIIRYDIPVLEKLFNIDFSNKTIIDTLGISWYLYPTHKIHGLEVWGKTLGVHKKEIDDWVNLTLEQYTIRCETDVEINYKLWIKFDTYLKDIYQDSEEQIPNLLNYLRFKLECLKEQEDYGFYLNKELCIETKAELEDEINKKIKVLSVQMPPGKVVKTKPKIMFKKDNSLSSNGIKWLEYLKENNLPEDTEEVREDGNPTSPVQLKDWLFSLGWIPETFKPSTAKGKENEKIPQISLPFGQGICPSVKKLYETYPYLEDLEGLFMLQHRLGIINGYLEKVKENGYIHSTAHGLTNTLRLQHSKPINNTVGLKRL